MLRWHMRFTANTGQEYLAQLRGLGAILAIPVKEQPAVEYKVVRDLPQGLSGDDAFAVGSRLTVPLHDRSSRDAVAAVHELGLTSAISAREPTLDDVYLRLTGDSLAVAA